MKHPELIVGGLIVILIVVIGVDSSARRQSTSVVKTPISQKQIAVVKLDDSNVPYRNFPELGVSMRLSDKYSASQLVTNPAFKESYLRFSVSATCYVGAIGRANKDSIPEHQDPNDLVYWTGTQDSLREATKERNGIAPAAKEFDSFFLYFNSPHEPCFEKDSNAPGGYKVSDDPLPPGPRLREAVLSAIELK